MKLGLGSGIELGTMHRGDAGRVVGGRCCGARHECRSARACL